MKPLFTLLLCTILTFVFPSCQNTRPKKAANTPTTPPVARQETAGDRKHLEGQLTEAMRTLVPGYRNQPITYSTPTGKRTFTPKN